MNGSKRERIQQSRLDELESDFEEFLVSLLKECAAGRWGLFGQNDPLDAAKYLYWPEAEALKQRAHQIHALHEASGQPNAMVERFLHYCALRGANVPGEPKLGKALLDEIGR